MNILLNWIKPNLNFWIDFWIEAEWASCCSAAMLPFLGTGFQLNLGPISMGFYNSTIHCLLTMIKVWKTLKYTYTLHSCIGNENGGKKLSLTDVTKSWFRLWDTSTSCKTLIFTNFSSVRCHMSYRKGSLFGWISGDRIHLRYLKKSVSQKVKMKPSWRWSKVASKVCMKTALHPTGWKVQCHPLVNCWNSTKLCRWPGVHWSKNLNKEFS